MSAREISQLFHLVSFINNLETFQQCSLLTLPGSNRRSFDSTALRSGRQYFWSALIFAGLFADDFDEVLVGEFAA
jgi:hypothetical protein